ncbi:MAG: hypothetical protein KatS3mg109_0125 [Pirellulaceae bacterium]|nr:MAG: hypothetical protein KatS3mg109_0125 [Pirellulaceae bacterium]
MSIIDLVIIALATNQIVEIWHHSSLFASIRQKLQLMNEDPELLPHKWLAKPVELLNCPWCFSVWVALLCVLLSFTIAWWLLAALACSRLANVINDALKKLR